MWKYHPDGARPPDPGLGAGAASPASAPAPTGSPEDPGMTRRVRLPRVRRRAVRARPVHGPRRPGSPTRSRPTALRVEADGRGARLLRRHRPLPGARRPRRPDADLLLCEAAFVESGDNPADLHLTGKQAGARRGRGRGRPAGAHPRPALARPAAGARRGALDVHRPGRAGRHRFVVLPLTPTDGAGHGRVGAMTRADGRSNDQLRPVKLTRHWLDHAAGSVLVEFGSTRVLCAASAQRGRAALAQGLRAGLGDRGVRHAARRPPTPAPTASRSRAGSAAAPTRSPG